MPNRGTTRHIKFSRRQMLWVSWTRVTVDALGDWWMKRLCEVGPWPVRSAWVAVHMLTDKGLRLLINNELFPFLSPLVAFLLLHKYKFDSLYHIHIWQLSQQLRVLSVICKGKQLTSDTGGINAQRKLDDNAHIFYVIICPVTCGMKLSIHSQTSSVRMV